MTSLDDSIISRQNLMLLDNITNYSRPALDYFHHNFDKDALEIPLTWSLFLKMRKHKLLRLPNCSIEDDRDYAMYSVRLHHCLWRRWSIQQFKLESLKIDPLSINWDKEIDITVLYGPDLAGDNSGMSEQDSYVDKSQKMNLFEDAKSSTIDYEEEDIFQRGYSYSSSVDSNTSSIFEQNICTKVDSNTSNKSLKFSDTVLRRDIDKFGACHETEISINDVKRNAHRGLHFHPRLYPQYHSKKHNSNMDKEGHHVFVLPDNDDEMLEQNIRSLNLDSDTYIHCS